MGGPSLRGGCESSGGRIVEPANCPQETGHEGEHSTHEGCSPMAHTSARGGDGAADQCVVPGLQEDCRRSEEMSVFLNGDGAHDTVPELPWSREAYTRVILQALHELGYRRSAMELEQEAGVQVNSSQVKSLEQAVMDGEFGVAESLVEALGLDDSKTNRCRFILRRHKYLELLERDDCASAMQCLQVDITPLGSDPATLHALAALLVCQGPALKEKAQWHGGGPGGRHELLKALKSLLPPTVLLPPRRLQTLTHQALQHQMEHCVRYNHVEPWSDLLQDCFATEDRIPSHTVMRLDHHTDEVWFVQFSHSGKLLASASKDKTIAIWDVCGDKPVVVKVLSGHHDSVSFLAWSPDDARMLSCGNDCTIKLWDMEAAVCVRNFLGHSEAVTALAWLPGGRRFVSGGCDKKIFTWQLDCEEAVGEHHGERVVDLAVSRDGARLVTIAPDKRIRIFDLPHMHETACVADHENLTSMSLSADGKHLLVNLSALSAETRPEIQLWDLDEKVVVRKFYGHKQGRYVIRSCFGGVRDSLVVCGSEDSQVYIWNRATGALLRTLQGHAGTINAVAWCPTNPRLFASASDDNTVRLWGCPAQDSSPAATNAGPRSR